jgi:hypothetical protein
MLAKGKRNRIAKPLGRDGESPTGISPESKEDESEFKKI